jgi:hypothetical protein
LQGLVACSQSVPDDGSATRSAYTASAEEQEYDSFDGELDPVFDETCDACNEDDVVSVFAQTIDAPAPATPDFGAAIARPTPMVAGNVASGAGQGKMRCTHCAAPKGKAGALLAAGKWLFSVLKGGAKWLGPKSLAALRGLGKVVGSKKFEKIVTVAVATDLILEFSGAKKALMDEAKEKRDAGDKESADELEKLAGALDSFIKATESLKATLEEISKLEEKIAKGEGTDADKTRLRCLETLRDATSAVIAEATKQIAGAGGTEK